MKKHFIITIDTESDNQWNSSKKQSTENARFIPRFQTLCEKYGYKPVYLVDYSMAHDLFLVDFLKKCQQRGTCEIGMHLHAWDTPPVHEFDRCNYARPYLIEYPEEIMYEKIATIHSYLGDVFECEIVSHRAGRWATNPLYFDLLERFGYKIDCSYTPGISWCKTMGVQSGGSDYSKDKDEVSFVGTNLSILEVPMTIDRMRQFSKPKNLKGFVKESIRYVTGKTCWLRPALSNNEVMKKILTNRKQDYVEFMMHSSELMPGGSPYFKTPESIEKLYTDLDLFFKYASDQYEGLTLKQFRATSHSTVLP